jgi:hypothetical protein
MYYHQNGSKELGVVINEEEDEIVILKLELVDPPSFSDTANGRIEEAAYIINIGPARAILPQEVRVVIDNGIHIQRIQILTHIFVYVKRLFIGHRPTIIARRGISIYCIDSTQQPDGGIGQLEGPMLALFNWWPTAITNDVDISNTPWSIPVIEMIHECYMNCK